MRQTSSWVIVFALAASAAAWGQEQPAMSDDEAAIRKLAESYVEAFNKKDAEGLAAHWSPDAIYINRMTNESAVGREELTEQFKTLFQEQPELKIDLKVDSVQLLSPGVAVEHGTATFLAPMSEPDSVLYTAVHVKRDGKWLIDRVTDDEPVPPESPYKELQALEWMVGEWVDEDEEVSVLTSCNWTKNRTFLTRSYSVTVGDRIATSGVQIIGWDAAEKKVRSWTFDSDGSFAEGTWSKNGDQWYIHNKGVLADGRKASMTNVIKAVDQNSFTWQTVERSIGGELLPNVDEVLIVRR
jgi:uncharacterized protein (TIGR02246 family)